MGAPGKDGGNGMAYLGRGMLGLAPCWPQFFADGEEIQISPVLPVENGGLN